MAEASIKFVRTMFVALIVMSALPACASEGKERQIDRGHERIAPPVSLGCDRNQLTVYIGEVIEYHRDESSIAVTISTDWHTIEKVAVDIPESEESVSPFLINGQPFSESDWNKVESQPGSPITGLRVFAWVCLDEQTPPVIDWRPQR